MGASATRSNHRPRELRRRVMISARLRSGTDWGDARILNIWSRGLMIQTARPTPKGALVEIARSEHLIIARVMWSAAGRSGLQSQSLLPVEEILSLGQASSLQLVASDGVLRERRRRRRAPEPDARVRGRAMEFVAVGMIAASLALGIWSMAETALARPLERVTAALGG
jgi:hypothetical protein